MRTIRAVIPFLMLALAGGYALAAGPVAWNSRDYQSEFKLFTEAKAFDRAAWEALPPAQQEAELQRAKEPAARRLAAITSWYEAAMRPWDTRALKGYTSTVKEKDLQAAELWLGRDAARELAKKMAAARAALKKAPAEGLNAGDEKALEPYLTPEAIADLRAMRVAAGSAADGKKKAAAPVTASGEKLQKLSASLPAGDPAALDKFFDGSNSRGDAAVNFSGGVQGSRSAGAAAPVTAAVTQPARTQNKAAVPALPQQKSAEPQTKSTAWTSDAYGITVVTPQGERSYRDHRAAEAAIRQMPDGSIKKITLYGHGSPGLQTVGPGQYDALYTAELLDGKMAPGGVIQFSGCNTASIGDATLNPAVGLSMVARRLLYFSLPYWQDRADGTPSAQAKEQWEKEWNADLSRDTSTLVKGAVVCGYRTFGLVPGRLPVLTRIMGNQEATKPGVVAGKKACYKDGKEVPVP